jgi:DNA polymerase epsilon subunit 3
MTSEQSETPALTNENPPVQAAKSKNEAIEFEPPVACVRRLLKNALPKSTNVSKDSAAALTRACGIFVLYLASCANDLAREGRRTTVSAKDVLGALHELDFDEFIPQMEKFLEQHRKEEQAKKEEKERLKASKPEVEKKSEGVSGDKNDDGNDAKEGGVESETSGKQHPRDDEDGAESPSKKQKVDE